MMKLCPRARTDLFPIMASNAPFWTRPREELDFYFRQCFTVLDYLPTIRKQLIEFVIDKALEIDVNIKIKDGGEAAVDNDMDDNTNQEEQQQQQQQREDDGIFEIDLDDPSGTDKKEKRKSPAVDADVNDMSEKVRLSLSWKHGRKKVYFVLD